MIDEVDAVTCSTDMIRDYIRQLTDKPVITIPDRQDLEFHSKHKVHKGIAKKVCWFGYSDNTKVLDIAMATLKRHNVKLVVISDQRPPYNKADENVRWKLDTVNKEILKCDFVLMPEYKKGRFAYKSNNKTTTAWALGMPVATNPEEFRKFLDPLERRRESERRLKEIKEKWDCRLSVKELQNLIKEIQDGKDKRTKT